MAKMSIETRRERAAARKASAARIAEEQAKTRAIVATGVCPSCGSKIKRNLALTGWYQCEQYGSVGFRARNADAQCGWQGFTE